MSEQDSPLPERLRQALKETSAFKPPEAFYTQVLRQVRSKAEPKSRWAWLWATPMKLATSSVIIMVSYLAMRDKTPWSPQKPAAVYDQVSPVSRAKAMTEPTERDANNITDMPVSRHGNFVAAYKKDQGPVAAPKKLALMDKMTAPAASPVRFSSAENAKFPWQEVAAAHQALPMLIPKNPASPSKSFSGLNAPSTLQEKKTRPPVADIKEKTGSNPMRALRKMAPQSWRGVDSGITHFQEVVIATPIQWGAFWHAHTLNQPYALPLPPIDFGQSIVVGIMAGTRPDIVAVDILDIERLPEECLVLYQEIPLAAGEILRSAAQHPYYLRVIPKTTLPIHFKKQS